MLSKLHFLRKQAEYWREKAEKSENDYYRYLADHFESRVVEHTELILSLVKSDVDTVFFFLENTDYGYSPELQEIESYFWEKFFEYFKKLQKTEQNRIINQLSDIIE